MLFLKRFWEPVATGEVTVTFRRWKGQQVLAGRRYRTPAGIIEIESVSTWAEENVTDADARRAGHADVQSLLADLPVRPGLPLYRIQFHVVEDPDPRAELAASADLTPADIVEISRRLHRLDRASPHGPWTIAVLEMIESHPGRRAPDLAAHFGRETQPFKTDVRKLKNLGLTLSLKVGYRLSPRGEAYLSTIRSG
ncbi:MAG TPA: hypothetical protein VM848_02650 [Acidimicrobiia bacterium]|nr:hypothetical protein [Acidimicrobiia bacterium]